MNLRTFRNTLDELCATNSRNEKEDIIRGIDDPAAISFLAGSEFDSAGLGKTTVLDCANEAFSSDVSGKPTVSESLESLDKEVVRSMKLRALRRDMTRLAELSGNEQKEELVTMFKLSQYTSIVSFACLADLPTGVSETTIANALDVRDSLPFYEGVHEIVADDEPRISPEVGEAFKPMLAKSDSHLPDDVSHLWGQPKIDGYRVLLHVRPKGAEPRVSAFTRRMNDVTESLPELEEISFPAGEYIFDAEVIGADGLYNTVSKRIGRKAENVERETEMHFAIFDMLIHAGEEIFEQAYRYRFKKLDSALISIDDDRIGRLPVFENPDEARDVGRKYEGLIWKDPDAPYEFDKRSTNWIKEKNTEETVDVVDTDFIEGEGRLDGTLGKVKIASADGEPLGHTGSGFTDAMRDEVWENRDEYLGEPLEVSGEALDSQGSIRFPIFQRWRSDDGEADTFKRIEEIMPST
jgi:ATP-dependent DNA ligase